MDSIVLMLQPLLFCYAFLGKMVAFLDSLGTFPQSVAKDLRMCSNMLHSFFFLAILFI